MAGILNKGYKELHCKNNLSGIKNIYLFKFVPYFYTDIQVIEGLQLISYPQTIAYRYELRADYALQQSLNDEERWVQSLEVQLKKIDLSTTIEIDNLSRNIVGCVAEYESGKFALIGLRNGCEISTSTTTGSSKGDFSGYTLSIEALEDYQAPMFDSLVSVGFVEVKTEAFLLQENGDYLLQENDYKIKL